MGGRAQGRFFAKLTTAFVLLAGLAAASSSAGTERASAGNTSTTLPRQDRPPRKVLIGTVVSGQKIFSEPLEKRLNLMDELVGKMAAQANIDYPDKRLDLVVLPEFFLARPGNSLAQQTVRLEDVQPRIAACASRYGCYLVMPVLLQEAEPSPRYSNVALMVDRSGAVMGIYRKVHPVAPQGTDSIENGTTPGRDFPVFACDFGRVGIQICFDLLYPDGWAALARQGAEIVILPSASPETVRPAFHAMEHEYYIVSATPRDHAAFYSPLGLIEAEATQPGAVLVHEIDLSYALLHWEAQLDEGAALTRKYGKMVGYHYYHKEDMGIFWSNDPQTPIGQMIASLGLTESDTNVERIRRLQDQARGGPPSTP